MNPKLLIISLLGLACTINGQGTDSTNPIANVPAPSKQLTIFDLPSPQEIEADHDQIAALKRASVKSTQDKQAAIQSQLAEESARNMEMEKEMANQAMRRRIENNARLEAQMLDNEIGNEADARAVWENFPPPPEAGSTKKLPTGLPRPTDMGAFISRSSGTQADGQISVGNLQAIYDDELRTLMRDYNISAEEIKQILERYAQGGAATITKERTENGLQEIAMLDLESFISQRTGASITSVSPKSDRLPGGVSQVDFTSPPVDAIQDFLSAEKYLQEQIKELDAQFDALNTAYQQGTLTRLTRNENAIINRERRRRFITDLRAIQMEIKSRPGGEKMEPEIPLKNRVDDGEFFRNDPPEPTAFKNIPPEVTRRGGRIQSPTLRELELQIQTLEERLQRKAQERGLGRSGLGFNPGRIGNLNGPLPPRGQSPPPTGRPRRFMTPEQRAALRRELLNIRRREQLIFQRLSQLRNRNSRLMLPNVRDPFRQQLRQRVSFSNGNRPQLTRTLSGSVTGQGVLRRRTI
ncbi:uncharacterized protein LOC128162526 [Crassostrea angulata]|uniref:uncharacterized protein LOC128162526 n=1 Tax=Magallana angulata TaxID=2784310 RepID=UPI0022B09500|nr:uncharacterized protein LOC128162526 [Crassostrea angulata]